jgi:hypothetical protein
MQIHVINQVLFVMMVVEVMRMMMKMMMVMILIKLSLQSFLIIVGSVNLKGI